MNKKNLDIDALNGIKDRSFRMLFSAMIAVAVSCSEPEGTVTIGNPDIGTEGIQAAIDSAAKAGLELVFPKGTYICGTLELRSGSRIRLCRGSVLQGSDDPRDYRRIPGAPEGNPQADKCSPDKFAFIVADGCDGITISGPGRIDGRGLQVSLAADSLHHTGILVDPDYNTRRMRPGTRPKLLELYGCRNVLIEGVHLRSSAAWGLSLNKCEDVTVRKIEFVNRAYWNNDGIDITDSRRVLVEFCHINSADDGIVLKSFDPESADEDITIRRCRIQSSASALKFGTESFGGFKRVRISDIRVRDTFRSAIAIESVDGARVEDIRVEKIRAVNTGNAFFIRLGCRNADAPGYIRDVTVKDLRCRIPAGRPDSRYDVRGPDINTIHNPFPASVTGIPGAPLQNIRLENIRVSCPGGGTRAMGYVGTYRSVPEMESAYPEFHMFGELPAWGMYARHVDGLETENVRFRLRRPDYRARTVLEDVNQEKL